MGSEYILFIDLIFINSELVYFRYKKMGIIKLIICKFIYLINDVLENCKDVRFLF